MNEIEGDQYKVWVIQALKRPGHEKAKKMLEEIAKVVQPIMRKRKLRVNLLTEFCQPRLLGLNIGAGNHVKLRLRRFNREWDFLPFDEVLDTMLHELSHNVHRHHKADFHKLWNELRKECKELMPKKEHPVSSLCKRAVAAAEQMAKGMMTGMAKAIHNAIMGVVRKVQAGFNFIMQYDFWCGSQLSGDEHVNSNPVNHHEHKKGNAGNYRKRNHSTLPPNPVSPKKRSESNPVFSIPSDVKFVDLTTDTAKVESQRSGLAKVSRSMSSSMAGCSSQLSGDNGALHSEQHSMWECMTCTLLNKPIAPVCELCGTPKPKNLATMYNSWSCKFCTLENSQHLDKCAACDQWSSFG